MTNSIDWAVIGTYIWWQQTTDGKNSATKKHIRFPRQKTPSGSEITKPTWSSSTTKTQNNSKTKENVQHLASLPERTVSPWWKISKTGNFMGGSRLTRIGSLWVGHPSEVLLRVVEAACIKLTTAVVNYTSRSVVVAAVREVNRWEEIWNCGWSICWISSWKKRGRKMLMGKRLIRCYGIGLRNNKMIIGLRCRWCRKRSPSCNTKSNNNTSPSSPPKPPKTPNSSPAN